MFQVGIKRDFIANHFLIGGDWGHENSPHSHHFVLELVIQSDYLDQHNYVADIAILNKRLDTIISRYRDQLLNEQESFANQNPSIEIFAKILHSEITNDLDTSRFNKITTKLWEDESAWASFEKSYV